MEKYRIKVREEDVEKIINGLLGMMMEWVLKR